MWLPVSKRRVTVAAVCRDPDGPFARQFGEPVVTAADRGALLAHPDVAAADLVLLCSDDCALTLWLDHLSRELDRYVLVLDGRTEGAWRVLNLAPALLFPCLPTGWQDDLLFAPVTAGRRCLLLNGPAAGRGALAFPGAGGFACWPCLAVDLTDLGNPLPELWAALLGTVVPTAVAAAVFLAFVASLNKKTRA